MGRTCEQLMGGWLVPCEGSRVALHVAWPAPPGAVFGGGKGPALGPVRPLGAGSRASAAEGLSASPLVRATWGRWALRGSGVPHTKGGLGTEGPNGPQGPAGVSADVGQDRPPAPLTCSRRASCSCRTRSLRACCTAATSTSRLCCPGAGEGHRGGEWGQAGGLVLCRPE